MCWLNHLTNWKTLRNQLIWNKLIHWDPYTVHKNNKIKPRRSSPMKLESVFTVKSEVRVHKVGLGHAHVEHHWRLLGAISIGKYEWTIKLSLCSDSEPSPPTLLQTAAVHSRHAHVKTRHHHRPGCRVHRQWSWRSEERRILPTVSDPKIENEANPNTPHWSSSSLDEAFGFHCLSIYDTNVEIASWGAMAFWTVLVSGRLEGYWKEKSIPRTRRLRALPSPRPPERSSAPPPWQRTLLRPSIWRGPLQLPQRWCLVWGWEWPWFFDFEYKLFCPSQVESTHAFHIFQTSFSVFMYNSQIWYHEFDTGTWCYISHIPANFEGVVRRALSRVRDDAEGGGAILGGGGGWVIKDFFFFFFFLWFVICSMLCFFV